MSVSINPLVFSVPTLGKFCTFVENLYTTCQWLLLTVASVPEQTHLHLWLLQGVIGANLSAPLNQNSRTRHVPQHRNTEHISWFAGFRSCCCTHGASKIHYNMPLPDQTTRQFTGKGRRFILQRVPYIRSKFGEIVPIQTAEILSFRTSLHTLCPFVTHTWKRYYADECPLLPAQRKFLLYARLWWYVIHLCWLSRAQGCSFYLNFVTFAIIVAPEMA